MNKSYKTLGIIFLVVFALIVLVQLTSETPISWKKNFSVSEKSPYGLFIFDQESKVLFKNKIKKIEVSPYAYYEEHKNQKPHNILIIEKKIDEVSWTKILHQVSKGSDVMILSEELPDYITDTLQVKSSKFNFSNDCMMYFTDTKLASDSIVIEKNQNPVIFSKINFDKTEILGDEYYDSEDKDGLSSATNFIKVNFGNGNVYLHTEPLVVTNFYLLEKKNQNYIQDLFSFLPDRETLWFQKTYDETSDSPLRFIWANPSLRNAWLIFLFSVLIFIFFNAKRRQRVVPIIEPLKNTSVDFVRSIGNLYMQEGDFHDMMAKKANYFLSRVRTELLIDTQNLNEEFEKKLQLKTGKSPEKIKEALVLIKKSLNPSAHVINEDLITLNKILNEILK